jgi:Lrp/AsnC family transcriptional regulator for asnA, asnC and gidA
MTNPSKRKPPVLDDLDQKIIRELQSDGRQSYLKLGKKVGASEGTIRNRIRAGQKQGLINIKAVLDPPKLGFDFSCVLGLEIALDDLAEAEEFLAKSPNVYYLSDCAGTFDLIAIVIFRNTLDFDKFMKTKIARLPGIRRTQTFVNMRIIKKPWINDPDVITLLES